MLLLDHALSIFASVADSHRVPARKQGMEYRGVTRKEREVIRSVVRTTVSHALGVPVGANVNIASVLADRERFANAAEEAARANEVKNARSYRSPALTFFDAVAEGRACQRRPFTSIKLERIEEGHLPANWCPLFRTFTGKEGGTHTHHRGPFAEMAKVLDAAGYAPEILPHDREAVVAVLEAGGMPAQRIKAALSAYRAARAAAGLLDLPELREETRWNAAGTKTVPEFKQWKDLETAERLEYVAPELARARRLYLAPRALSPKTLDRYDALIDLVAAAHARAGRPAAERLTLNPVSLFTTRLTPPAGWAAAAQHEAVHQDLNAGMLAITGRTAPAQAVTISLMAYLVEQEARASQMRSPLYAVQDGAVCHDRLFYTSNLIEMVKQVFRMAVCYKDALLKSEDPADRALWATADGEYRELLARLHQHNSLNVAEGRANKARLRTTWPVLALYGTAALRRRVRVAEAKLERYRERQENHGRSVDTERGRVLTNRLEFAITDFALWSVVLNDAMRGNNYAGGIAGAAPRSHFRPEFVRDDRGVPVGLASIRTTFRRNDGLAELKKKNPKDVTDRERPAQLLDPAFVDLEILWRHWSWVRPRRLQRLGLIASADAFQADTEGFPMFVPAQGGNRKRPDGHYSVVSISNNFGRVLHWVCVSVLRLNDRPGLLPEDRIPAWRELRGYRRLKSTDPERYRLLKAWSNIFCGHYTRNAFGAYFGGLRQKWAYTGERTDDSQRTLLAHYSHLYPGIGQEQQVEGPGNPHFYDALIDRMVNNPTYAKIDWTEFWARFDPANPAAAVQLLDGAARRR
jgi:hypothetical protein